MLNIIKMCYDNNARLLKECAIKQGRINEYLDIILSSLSEMFSYTSNVFDVIDYKNIETILRIWGTIGFCYDDEDNIVYGFAYCGGKRNKKGIGQTITIQCLDGSCYVKNIDECVLGFNNTTRSGDRIIYWFAKQFCETDISQVNNVMFSRQAPLFVAKTNRIKQFIQTAFNNIKNGKLDTIVDDSVLSKGEKSIDSVNLTDVNAIDKLQYLDTYHNSLLRRIYTLFGCALAEGMKLAQQSVDEVTSNSKASMVIPNNNLSFRKKMCDDFENFFNKEFKVSFSGLMKERDKNNDEVQRVF